MQPSRPPKHQRDMCFPTSAQDGANTNNIITVLPRVGDKLEVRERLLSPVGKLTEQERLQLAAMLCPWESHDLSMHLEPQAVPQPTLAQRVAATEAALALVEVDSEEVQTREGAAATGQVTQPLEDAANSSY